MLLLILAFGLPALVAALVLALPSTRRRWSGYGLRFKVSTALLAASLFLIIVSIIHIVAAVTSSCSQPDCTMGYALGFGLLLPIGLLLFCSGLLLRARPVVAIVGHVACALVAADFVLWATLIDYNSFIPWSN